MALESSQAEPGPELQAAFRSHLQGRLGTLLRRARGQCRHGWDCNVLQALHAEIAMLAAACDRYGEAETGERLSVLESALAGPVAARGVPDAAASGRIDGLLDGLRPRLRAVPPGPAAPGWLPEPTAVAADAASARCEVPPEGYWRKLGIADLPVAAPSAAAAPAAAAASQPRKASGPRASILNDDDPAVTELMLRLEQHGCETALVDQLDELIAQLRLVPPELVVLVVDPDTALEKLGAAIARARRDPARKVRLLALLRGAQAELQLRALRAGADRCIALPASAADLVGAARELLGTGQESAYRVLIVDDDSAQALFAQAILRHSGMETRILAESLPVLDELDRFRPDLVLLDLNMPDCDGYELTAMIRERDRYLDLPIVFLSGDQDEERQFAALDAGADDFLVKPIRPAHLVAAVTNRVRRARLAAARRRQHDRRDRGTGLAGHARLLAALAQHLVAGPPNTGGLLALEVHAAAALRAQLGLTAFDRTLGEVGAFVVAHVPAECLTACHGGAGYLVFAPDLGERELAALARELMTAAQDARFGANASALGFTGAVFGIEPSTREPTAALAALERALALARGQPGQVVRHSRLRPDPSALAELVLGALATDGFALAFQPLVAVHDGTGPRYQALLRLRTPEREYVAAELIPVAARMGSIGIIDAWVASRCAALLGRRQPLTLVASQSLAGWQDEARQAALQSELVAARVPPGALVLEFPVDELRAHVRTLLRLAAWARRAGVKLSLAGADQDAVAAGWVGHLPVDSVKLSPRVDADGLLAVVAAAHERGIEVVAPHVETPADVDRLEAAGVDFMQGEHFRKAQADLDAVLPGVGG